MKCQYYSCSHNSIHDGDKPKGFCSVSDEVEINKYRECNTYEFCGEANNHDASGFSWFPWFSVTDAK